MGSRLSRCGPVRGESAKGRTIAASAAVVALLAGCTNTPHAPSASASRTGSPTASRSTAPPKPAITALWRTNIKSMETPQATAAGFAFLSATSRRDFEAVSLDAHTGKVLWRSPASPSYVASGIVMRLAVAVDRSLVVWMRPGLSYRGGFVTVTAADARTGRIAWTFGNGRLIVNSGPERCREGRRICLIGRHGPGAQDLAVELDARTGKELSSRPYRTSSFREVGDGLRESGNSLVAVDAAGRTLWARPYREVYGGEDVTPDSAWAIYKVGGRYIGSLGYRAAILDHAPRTGERMTYDLRDIGATAAFDARTGRTVWLRRRASLSCGGFEFSPSHPVVCTYRGKSTFRSGVDQKRTFIGLDISVEGVDPATGRTTWSWHAGAAPGLMGGEEVVRIGQTTYAVPSSKGTVLLDLARGVSQAPTPSIGWCVRRDGVIPSAESQMPGNEGRGYNAESNFPCRLAGAPADVPASAPAFAGEAVAGVFAWTDDKGLVRAGTVTGGR